MAKTDAVWGIDIGNCALKALRCRPGDEPDAIIADAFEAVIGAIYLDGGYDQAKAFIERTILDDEDISVDVETNHKSTLLEKVQAKKMGHPVYRTVSEKGPDHNKVFTVEVFVNRTCIGSGKGKSKKAAQQMAAKAGLSNIDHIIVKNYDSET